MQDRIFDPVAERSSAEFRRRPVCMLGRHVYLKRWRGWKVEVEMPFMDHGGAIMRGILRLRMPIRFAHRHGPLRMTKLR
jgi:hypothetical protein